MLVEPNDPLLLIWNSLSDPAGEVVTALKDKTPEPLVVRACPFEPSAPGKVHTLLVLTVDGLAKPT